MSELADYHWLDDEAPPRRAGRLTALDFEQEGRRFDGIFGLERIWFTISHGR